MAYYQKFKESDKKHLAKILTRLADYMRRERITRIIGGGPTATPFTRMIARAYERRHGKKLDVLNLGDTGEMVIGHWFNAGEPEWEPRELLKARPGLAKKKKSLLFDESVSSGRTMAGLSNALYFLRVPHRTATLIHVATRKFPEPDIDLDFVGKRITEEHSWFPKIYWGRAATVSEMKEVAKKERRALMKEMRQRRAELKEIAERIEPKPR